MRHTFSRVLQQNLAFIFTFILLSEGIFFTTLYWLQPSSEKNARFGGYSLEKLLIGSVSIIILVGLAFSLYVCVRKPETLKKFQAAFLEKLSHSVFRQSFIILLGVFLSILLTYLLVNWFRQDEVTFSAAIFQKIYPFVLWAILAILEAAGLLVWACLRFLRPPITKKEMLTTVLAAFVLGLVVWQWLTLFFQIKWPYLFSQSVWSASNTFFSPLHYILVIGWGCAAIALLLWIRKKGLRRLAFLALLAWGFIGQLIIPIRDAQHVGDVLTRYQDSAIAHVLYSVCHENPGYSRILSQYDKYESSDFWLGTKPPGYFLFYSALADAAKGLSGADCQTALPSAILFLFPFLAVLTFLPMRKLSQILYQDNSGLVNVLLFTLATMVYYVLTADQALYPLLFITTVWLTIETTRRSNFWMAALLGILIYLDMFISFSLLPAAGFSGVWFLLNWLCGPRQNRIRLFKLGLLVLFCFSAACLLLWGLGGYNPWVRYQNAFANHREIKNFDSSLGAFVSTMFLNTFEFFYWMGISVVFLFLGNLIDTGRKFIRRDFTLPVLFSVSAGIIFLVLNFAGQTKGEVSRLWLFMTPLVVILAGERLQRFPVWIQYAYVLLQTLTILLVFHFSFAV